MAEQGRVVLQAFAARRHLPGCGGQGSWHDTFTRWFTHLPVGRAATKLHVSGPRYRCRKCAKVWRHRLQSVAQPRSKLTRTAMWWALQEVVLDHAAVSAVAAVLQTAWGTVHDAVTELGQQVLIDHPERLEGCGWSGLMSTAGATRSRARSTSPWSST